MTANVLSAESLAGSPDAQAMLVDVHNITAQLRGSADIFRAMTEELLPVTIGLGTQVKAYERATERDLCAPRWDSTSASFKIIQSTSTIREQGKIETGEPAITMQDVPAWIAGVLKRKQIAKIEAGEVTSAYELLTPRQLGKLERQNSQASKADERRDARNLDLQMKERIAHENRKRSARAAIGINALDAYRLSRPF